MKKEFVRNPYNYNSDDLSEETGLLCKDESRTEQEGLHETDINYIAQLFLKTGEIPQVIHMPTHGDFTGIFDFQTAMNTIQLAKNEFMSLPAKTRTRFNNDPAELIAFIEDDANRDEAIKLGFIPKPDIISTPPTTDNDNGTDTSGRTERIQETPPRADRTQNHAAKNEGTQKS